MSAATAAALAAVVLVLAFTPGPVVIATVARALASGLAPALGFSVGVALVDLGYLLLTVYGLSAVAHLLGELFVAVKIAGAIYLFWLGLRLWLIKTEAPSALPMPGAGSRRFGRGVVEGIAVDLANPKLILFYAAFLPTFVDLARLRAPDVALLCAIVVGILLVVNLGFAWLAAYSRRFVTSMRAMTALNRASGTLMIGAAIWLVSR